MLGMKKLTQLHDFPAGGVRVQIDSMRKILEDYRFHDPITKAVMTLADIERLTEAERMTLLAYQSLLALELLRESFMHHLNFSLHPVIISPKKLSERDVEDIIKRGSHSCSNNSQ